jgi:hypothetical protein
LDPSSRPRFRGYAERPSRACSPRSGPCQSEPVTTLACPFCGGAKGAGSVRCLSCGRAVAPDAEATTEHPTALSPLELVAAQRADRLCQHLRLAPGESALVLTRGPGRGSSFRLGYDIVTLGRQPSATILLDDVTVSRRHAEIRPEPAGYRVVDVGSLNGTYVNHVQVDEAQLFHGDEIQIGLFKLSFVARGPGTQATRAATPPR